VDGAARPLVSAGGAFWGHDVGAVCLLVFSKQRDTHGLRARSHAQKSFSVYCSRGGKGRRTISGSAALAGASCVGADVCCCVLLSDHCPVWCMDRLPPSDAFPLIRLGVCVVWMALDARAARGCMKCCRARKRLMTVDPPPPPPHPPPLLTPLPGLRQAPRHDHRVRIEEITLDGAARPLVSVGGT
jgi:hypothetical protein